MEKHEKPKINEDEIKEFKEKFNELKEIQKNYEEIANKRISICAHIEENFLSKIESFILNRINKKIDNKQIHTNCIHSFDRIYFYLYHDNEQIYCCDAKWTKEDGDTVDLPQMSCEDIRKELQDISNILGIEIKECVFPNKELDVCHLGNNINIKRYFAHKCKRNFVLLHTGEIFVKGWDIPDYWTIIKVDNSILLFSSSYGFFGDMQKVVHHDDLNKVENNFDYKRFFDIIEEDDNNMFARKTYENIIKENWKL